MKLTAETKLILKTSFVSALLTVILLCLTSYFFNHTWNFFSNSGSKNPPITVQGTGTVSAAPDQSQVSFTVTKTAQTLQDAQNQANTFTNKIVNDGEKTGISKQDIQTSNYNSYPNYNDQTEQPLGMMQPQNTQTVISYTVSEDVTITIRDNAKTNSMIDTATRDGAENISGPSLTFSDAKQQDLENQARTKAIQNARQKAQSMADAAGIHLGKLVKIEEGAQTPYPVIRPIMMQNTTGTQKSVPTQINPGQNTVTATVTLSYETY